MEVKDLKKTLESLSDSLKFAGIRAEQATEELKAVKDVEVSLKEAANQIKKQSEELEQRIARSVTEKVLANLDPFFENSRKIRESAEAIHIANIKIQQVQQKSCKNKILYALLGGFAAGIVVIVTMYHFGFLETLKNML